MNQILENPYFLAFLKIFLIVYAFRLAPRLPNNFEKLFDNTFVKIAGITMIAWLSNKDFQLSLMLAIIFVLTINFVVGNPLVETFDSYSKVYKPYDITQKLLEPMSDIFPGCSKLTMNDLGMAFSGDAVKLQNAVKYSYSELIKNLPPNSDEKKTVEIISKAVGLPYNIEFNDANAPLIGTMLMMQGFNLSATCHMPMNNEQNPMMSLNEQTNVSPFDTGDYHGF